LLGQSFLKVNDNGIGIPLVEQKKIFQRFFRAQNTQKITGTGLGLYYVKQIINLHDGEIWFESKEGQGTTFFIKLKSSIEAYLFSRKD
jgi:signal transduction histidine kinase